MTPKRSPALALTVATLLFILSGATGLAYEVVWFKRFAQMWGGSSASMAAVVASFLFGLGLGARLLGRMADRSETPLKLYALFELLIAVMAIGVQLAIDWLLPVASSLYPPLSGSPVLFAFVRFFVTFLVLGPPTLLMGATLPLLVRQFAVLGTAPGHATAWLYFANSLGAAGGAWVAGFYLLPEFGLFWTNNLVAGTNVVIALVAWALVNELDPRRAGSAVANAIETSGESEAPPELPWRLLLAAGLTGLAGVALQMVWARQFAVLVGGSTYAFTSVLAVFILGIACGSLAFRLVSRSVRDLPWVIGLSAVGLVVTGLIGMGLRITLAEVAGEIRGMRGEESFNALFCFVAALLLEGGPTFFMGLFFPALVEYARAGAANVGSTVGRLYAWNTGGSILGATTTAVLLFPTLGSYGASLVMFALYGVTVLLLFPPTASGTSRAGVVLGGLSLAIAVVLGGLIWPSFDLKKRINAGHHLYGTLPFEQFGEESKVLMLEESLSSNVLVLALDAREMIGAPSDILLNIRVNGKVDGGNGQDMPTQLGTGYVPRLLRPDAKEVLVIGFGTGTTAGASLLFPDTTVDCCEIEEAMVEASQYFHEFNHAPELSPNYRTILEDGRNYIQGTEKRYDLIISEPSNPWIAGIGNLYTIEFYKAVREKMNPGAMLGQWLQAYSLSRTELALIANTMSQVFEHVALIRINDLDTMLLASPSPIVPSNDALDRAQLLVDGNETIKAELEEHFQSSDVRSLLLWLLMLGGDGLQKVIADEGMTDIVTDDNLRLEFDAPKYVFQQVDLEHVTVIQSVLHAASPEHYSSLIRQWGWSDEQLAVLKRLRAYFLDIGQTNMGLAMSELGLGYASESEVPEFLADVLLYRPPSDIDEFRAGVRLLLSFSKFEAQRLAAGLGQREMYHHAEAAYYEIAQVMPRSATVWASMAVVYDRLLRPDDVYTAALNALRIDPLNEPTQVVLRSLPADVQLKLEKEANALRAEMVATERARAAAEAAAAAEGAGSGAE